MKVILTEEQYKILEGIINEVTNNIFTNTIEVGSTVKIIRSDGEVEELKVTSLLDNSGFIEANDGIQKHIFSLDTAFFPENNTFTSIKRGTYVKGSNKKKPQLIIGGGNQNTIDNVSRVEIYNSNGELSDTLYTKLGEKDREKSDSDSEAEFEKQLAKDNADFKEKTQDEKDIYNMIMNDPQLKRTFYNQPTLFGGLLNFGKAKGVIPAKKLIDKYVKGFNDRQDKEESDFKNFKVNNDFKYEVVNKPIRLSYGEQKFERLVGKGYTARYQGEQQARGYSGKGTSKINYKIKLNEKAGEDIYRGTIIVFFEDGDSEIEKTDNIVIKIWHYKK